jgi:hypothetical protein
MMMMMMMIIIIIIISIIHVTVKAPFDTSYVIFANNKNYLILPCPEFEPGLF